MDWGMANVLPWLSFGLFLASLYSFNSLRATHSVVVWSVSNLTMDHEQSANRWPDHIVLIVYACSHIDINILIQILKNAAIWDVDTSRLLAGLEQSHCAFAKLSKVLAESFFWSWGCIWWGSGHRHSRMRTTSKSLPLHRWRVQWWFG